MGNLDHLKSEVEKNLEVSMGEEINDESQILELIKTRVAELMRVQPDLLMSYLYRLDIDEQKVDKSLKDHENAIEKIAGLILERQIERVKTKLDIKQDPIEGWEW